MSEEWKNLALSIFRGPGDALVYRQRWKAIRPMLQEQDMRWLELEFAEIQNFALLLAETVVHLQFFDRPTAVSQLLERYPWMDMTSATQTYDWARNVHLQ